MSDLDALLDERLRSIPDWPVPGVTFRDITPVLADPRGLPVIVAAMRDALADHGVIADAVAGIEARGFVLGAPLAVDLGVGFVPVRKQGKLPGDVLARTYDLEYGTATLEIQADAVAQDHRVVVVDDVLATGGTARATVDLLRSTGAEVAAVLCLLELPALAGRDALHDVPVVTLRAF
ncbi:MAG TPA: adenine phosphoribosyltransferase [Candidatus Nanopelagicales bacterium]|nr:adenine phosphoribosyltransferase [Candidatus Nanopelagicales bacterium]